MNEIFTSYRGQCFLCGATIQHEDGCVSDGSGELCPHCQGEMDTAADLLRSSMERFMLGNVV